MPQVLSGAAHVATQAPPEHIWPAAQVWPQAPQLPLSLLVFTSQPLLAVPSQFAKPVVQLATAQTPVVHVAAALGRAQTFPHAPQFVGLVWRLTSQPSAASASQSPKPVLHRTIEQALDVQPSVATLARSTRGPQVPQFEGSFTRLAQYVAGAVPQVVSGDAQVVPHTPPEHTWPAGHVVPQVPQLALSLSVSTSQPSAAVWLQSA